MYKRQLLVTSSIGNNIDVGFLEQQLSCKITKAKAYTAAPDPKAMFPNKNLIDVVDKHIQEKDYKLILLQSGSVDITNINTQNDVLLNTESNKQAVTTSTENIFKVAELAAAHSEKVILLDRVPRCDKADTDPCRMKNALSTYGNNQYDGLLENSMYKDKILSLIHI